jgi:hypothetical protein
MPLLGILLNFLFFGIDMIFKLKNLTMDEDVSGHWRLGQVHIDLSSVLGFDCWFDERFLPFPPLERGLHILIEHPSLFGQGGQIF